MTTTTTLSSNAQRTVARLQARATDTGRMPSLSDVNDLLLEMGFVTNLRTSVNVVERRTTGSRYVTSRHNGSNGYRLRVASANLDLDSSDTYYSANTWNYAQQLLNLMGFTY